MKNKLPVVAAVHVAGACNALKLADEALGVAIESLYPIPFEEQPAGVGSYDVIAYRETARLFLELFGSVADSLRWPPCTVAVRNCILGMREDPRNPAGLARAAVALSFAVASLDEASDAIDEADESGVGDAWYGKILAASKMLEMIQTTIECSTVRGHGHGPGMCDMN